MSKWTTDDLDDRIEKALIVQEHGRDDVDALDYLAHTSTADDTDLTSD
jgi:hypothetical protein